MIIQPTPTDGFDQHRICDTEIDPTNGAVTVSVGSFLDGFDKPSIVRKLRVVFQQWVPELLFSMDEVVNAHPDWVGGSPAPSIHCYWDVQNLVWKDMRQLDVAKADKWAEIKRTRASMLSAPLDTPFGPFDATIVGQKSITDSVMLMQTMQQLGNPITIDFTLANNTTATLDTAQMVQVGLLLGQRTQQIYSIGRTARVAIDAATTPEEVDAVVWQTV